MSAHTFSVALRTAGRLLADQRVPLIVAASLVRSAWAKSSADLLPAGATSGTGERAAMAAAEQTEWWCATCEGIPHRVTFAAERCPVCRGVA